MILALLAQIQSMLIDELAYFLWTQEKHVYL